jgi:hypothetical protein
MTYHPRRMTSVRFALAAVLALAVVVAVTARAAVESRFAFVRAVDKEGTPVAGLTTDDIVVEEDGVTCTVLAVTPASHPVAVILDTSSFAESDFQELRSAAHHFVAGLSGRDVAVYTGGAAATRLLDFTRDLDRVEAATDRTFAEPNAAPHRLDAIFDAAKHLGERAQSVTRIVVVSAGGPDASGRGPREVVDAVMASRSIVDVVDMQQARGRLNPTVDGRYSRRSTRPSLLRTDADAEFLRDMAKRTLGSYARIVDGSGYEASLRKLRAELQADVVVEYASSSSGAAKLRVGVRLPNVTLRGVAIPRPSPR